MASDDTSEHEEKLSPNLSSESISPKNEESSPEISLDGTDASDKSLSSPYWSGSSASSQARRQRSSRLRNTLQRENISIVVLVLTNGKGYSATSYSNLAAIFGKSCYEIVIFSGEDSENSSYTQAYTTSHAPPQIASQTASQTASHAVPYTYQYVHPYVHQYSQSSDSERYLEALQMAATQYPQYYTLVLRDTAITNLSPEKIQEALYHAITTMRQNYQCCYLLRSHDDCLRNREVSNVNGMRLVVTTSPYGMQAILYSPSGRDMLLGATPLLNDTSFKISDGIEESLHNAIETNGIRALAFEPQIFSYDFSRASSEEDYMKNNVCRASKPDTSVQQAISFGLFIMIFIVLLLLVLGIGYLMLVQSSKGSKTILLHKRV